MRQLFDGNEVVYVLKNVGYATKCRTNLVTLTNAQRGAVRVYFEASIKKKIAMHNGRKIIFVNSSTTVITELSGTKLMWERNSYVLLFNTDDDDSMKLAYREIFHTAGTTLEHITPILSIVLQGWRVSVNHSSKRKQRIHLIVVVKNLRRSYSN